MSQLLRKLVHEYGLSDYLDLFEPLLLPCIGFTPTPGAPEGLKASRLGGGPEVPAGFVWPDRKGRPLDFLLQVNLADIAPIDHTGRFPATGLLSFFYDIEDQPSGGDPHDRIHAAYYYPPDATLEPRPAPDPEVALEAANLHFWPAECLPVCGSLDGERLHAQMTARAMGRSGFEGSTEMWYAISEHHKAQDELGKRLDREHDAYHAMVDALFRDNAPDPNAPFHRLGGHSVDQQAGMQEVAQLTAHGMAGYGNADGDDPRVRELLRTCDQWKLLLELDSGPRCDDMCWGDCGMLYVWAHAADIAARDYSKTQMIMECG